MKRNLLLLFIYLIQLVLVALFMLPQTKGSMAQIPAMASAWSYYRHFLDWFSNTVYLSRLTSGLSHRLQLAISAVVFNILFLIVYKIIAWLICLIIRHHRKKKIEKKGITIALSQEKLNEYQYQLFIKKFSWKGLVSFIIPLLIVIGFILVRYDKSICTMDANSNGFMSIYQYSIEPFLRTMSPSLSNLVVRVMRKYFSIMNQIIATLGGMTWIEYVIVVVGFILLFLIWWLFVYIFTRIFRVHSAKKRAKRAKEKYIAKMEKEELKARKNTEKRISSKAEEILGTEEETPVFDEDVTSIANVDKDSGVPIHVSDKEAEYIDDISTGVTDLGVAGSIEDDKELISERIPIFVGDEEVDIKLENEQVLDVVEDYEDEEIEEEEDPFFEKYHPDNIDTSYLDDSLLNTQIEVYEEEEPGVQEEDFVGIQNYDKEGEEIIVEPKEENEENLEENEEVLIEKMPEELFEEQKEEEKPKEVEEVVIKETPQEEPKEEEKPQEVEEVVITETPTEEIPEETVKEEIIEEEVLEEVPPVEKKKITPIAIPKKHVEEQNEEKKDIKPITPIRKPVEDKRKIKPIGPINVNRKYNDENRFKNAKSKYLDIKISQEEEKKQKEAVKKRHLVRRKKAKK